MPDCETHASHQKIEEAIKAYAMAYAEIELVQQNPATHPACLIPRGDQKTGSIGEYWAMRYARKRWGDGICFFGNHSQHGWDIRIEGTDMRIQVKTVSEWSKSRGLSPIHAQTNPPENAPDDWARWTHLWLIYLNKNLTPRGFWQLVRKDVNFQDREQLTGIKICLPDVNNGSSCLTWPKNTVSDLLSPLITAH